MRNASSKQDLLMHIAPLLQVLQFFSLWEGEIIGKLNLLGVFIFSVHACRDNGGGMENSGELRTEQMSFLSNELGVRFNISIEISREDVFYLAGCDKILRATVWQLDPVIQQVVGDPEYSLVYSRSAWLNSPVLRVFLGSRKATIGNPVVRPSSEDLTTESNRLSTTHNGQSLKMK